MSLMSSLYTGTSGLRIAQNALNTTAHNMANVDTKGYTRQQVIITDNNYQTVGSNNLFYFQIGTGTDIAKVMTYRNIFYDQSYRASNGRLGFYTAQYEAVNEIENLVGETEGVAFQKSVTSLWNGLQELCKDPGNIVVRSTFVNSCGSFLEHAANITEQLCEYQKSLNTNIVNCVSQINKYGEQIAELNAKICTAEAGGVERANDLRDQRDLILDQMSELVQISYKEDMNGAVNVWIEGKQFVVEGDYYKMDTAKVNENSELVKPVWPHLDNKDVFKEEETISTELGTDIGYLKGLVIGRGTREANYTDIPVEPKRENFASDAEFDAAKEKFDKDLKEYYKSIDSSTIMTMQAQFDKLIHGIVTMINDTLCPNKEITDAVTGEKYLVLDTEKAPVGMDADNTQGLEIFSRKNVERYKEMTINGETYYVYQQEKAEEQISLYTIGQLKINQEILSDYSKLPLSANNGSKEFDLETCKQLISKWQENFSNIDPGSLTTFNFNNYYTNLVGAIANRGSLYRTKAENQQLTLNQIEGIRQSVLGVNSDDELTNIIRFQHAYGASSRYITTVNDMLETLLNL